MSDPDDSALLFRFFTEIAIIEQLARNRLERILPNELTLSQFTVLHHFARLEVEQSPLELARAMQVSKATMSNTLQKLTGKGLVAVRADPRDGRGKIAGITAEGRAVRDQAIAKIGPELVELAQKLGRDVFAASLPNLEIIRRQLDVDRNA